MISKLIPNVTILCWDAPSADQLRAAALVEFVGAAAHLVVVNAANAHAFETLGCNRVSFVTDIRNTRSQAAIALFAPAF